MGNGKSVKKNNKVARQTLAQMWSEGGGEGIEGKRGTLLPNSLPGTIVAF